MSYQEEIILRAIYTLPHREILTGRIFHRKPYIATCSDFNLLFFVSTKRINMQNGKLMITKPHYCYYSYGY